MSLESPLAKGLLVLFEPFVPPMLTPWFTQAVDVTKFALPLLYELVSSPRSCSSHDTPPRGSDGIRK